MSTEWSKEVVFESKLGRAGPPAVGGGEATAPATPGSGSSALDLSRLTLQVLSLLLNLYVSSRWPQECGDCSLPLQNSFSKCVHIGDLILRPQTLTEAGRVHSPDAEPEVQIG